MTLPTYRLFSIPMVLLILVSACHQPDPADLHGLWQLTDVNVDGLIKTVPTTLVDLKADNSFALSKVAGDFLGFYTVNGSSLRFRSQEGEWFNANWQLMVFNDHFVLKGLDDGYRVTRLVFRRIDQVPDFADFEEKVLGRWELYKIRRKGGVERVSDMWLEIDQEGSYTIFNDQKPVESGMALVNTRHRRIIFENDELSWRAWFYGDELRLHSKDLDLQYDLRKIYSTQ